MTDIRVPSGSIESQVRDFALKRILAQAGRKFSKLAKQNDALSPEQLQDIAQHILFLADVGMSEWMIEVGMQRSAEGDVLSGWTKEIAQHQRDYEASIASVNRPAVAFFESLNDEEDDPQL